MSQPQLLEDDITKILHFFSSADGNFTVKLMTKATIHFNGEVVWKPPAIYKSLCPINVEFFPFDEQSCTLKIGEYFVNLVFLNSIKIDDISFCLHCLSVLLKLD